jgi:hypothetical protein
MTSSRSIKYINSYSLSSLDLTATETSFAWAEKAALRTCTILNADRSCIAATLSTIGEHTMIWKVPNSLRRPTGPCVTSHSDRRSFALARPKIRTRISTVRVMLRRDNRSTNVLSAVFTYIKYQLLKPINPTPIGHPSRGQLRHFRRLQNQPPVLLSEPLQSVDVSKAVSFNIRVFLLHNPCLYNLCSFYALLPWTPRVCRVSTLRLRKYMYLYYTSPAWSLTTLLLIGMRVSILQQNFHSASNMHFEELCLVVCICLFSLLFYHSLVFSPRPAIFSLFFL